MLSSPRTGVLKCSPLENDDTLTSSARDTCCRRLEESCQPSVTSRSRSNCVTFLYSDVSVKFSTDNHGIARV